MQGAVGARWAQKMGAKAVYILHDNGLYGKGVAAVFQQTRADAQLDRYVQDHPSTSWTLERLGEPMLV